MNVGLGDPLEDLLAPERCVLLVVDKQRWYLDAAVSPFLAREDADAVALEVSRHDRFIDLCRGSGIPVVWTVMTEGDDHAPPNVRARWTRRPDAPRLRRGDAGFAFAGAEPRSGEAVFEKVYPDAFSVDALQGCLQRLARTTIVLIGGYAARCVLASAFGAQSRGLHVVVPRGLAEPHPRHRQEEAVFLAIIDTVVGHVLDPEALERRWGRPPPPGRAR